MKRSIHRVVTLLALTALPAVSLGCGGSGASDADASRVSTRVEGRMLILAPDSARLAALSSAVVVLATSDSVVLNGRVVWNEDITVRVFSPFAGRVVSILVDAGRTVRQGDTLALIASPDFGQAQADARRAATDLTLAERTLARTRDLFEHGVVAQKDVYGAEADAARARAESQRAGARLALYGADSASANQVFALRAPLGGTVVERNITPGQEVRPDQMLANAPQLFAPLLVVTDPSRLWVQLDVPERDLHRLSAGAPIDVRAQAWPDRGYRGSITLVASAVDQATRTVKMRGAVQNPERTLKAEMLVTVRVAGASDRGLAIPAAAVLLSGDRHIVFVEEARGRYRRAEVTIGPGQEGMVRVPSGLRVGERVVTGGSLLLEQLFQQNAHS